MKVLFRICSVTGVLVFLNLSVHATSIPNQEEFIEFKISAKQFEFNPKTIIVRKGQRVRLLITPEDKDHGFAIKELGIDEVLPAGKTTSIEFVATKSGHFKFFCSEYCGDGHANMTGELVVTDSRTAGQSGVNVSFDDSSPGVVIVESNGERIRIDTAKRTVAKLESAPSVPAPPVVARDTTRKPRQEEEPYDYRLINLPTPKRVIRHSLNLNFSHRFSEPINPLRTSARDLLGLDSFSVSTLGVTYGITDRLYVTAQRSPICQGGLCRTIEIGAGFHLLDEKAQSPIALNAYASVEGDENFTDRFTYNLQMMMSRSVTKYVHVFFSPAVHFESNGDRRFDPKPDDFFPPEPVANQFNQPRHTGSFGFGISGQIRPTVSLMFEFTPRVGFKLGAVRRILDPTTFRVLGFKSESEPEIGFGVGKRIGRHYFSLTFSNTQTTTTSRYNSSNLVLSPSHVVIGFNLYRRFFQ